jgi:hypothetical protein
LYSFDKIRQNVVACPEFAGHETTAQAKPLKFLEMQELFPCLKVFGCVLALMFGASHARALYLDADAGNDAADGLSPAAAWKTLARANAFPYQPGDSLLFRRGARWAGQFNPASGEGTVQNPIHVGAYGTGPRPLIEGEGQIQDAVVLQNRSWWTLTTLEVTNQGGSRAAGTRRTGIRVVTDNFGVMRGIRLRDLVVRDVNGSLVKHNTQEGHGILFAATGNTEVGGQRSRFDDFIIEDTRLERTDRNGISQYTGNGTRSTGVVIRRNTLEDIGGDGIKIWGANDALVEHNVVRGGRMRAQDHAAGIWPFEADRTIIQFNAVTGMKGTTDGQGYDADYRTEGTVIQYNYSAGNEGGFILLCAPGNSYSRGTVVRYNISVGDGINTARVFQLGGKITNTRIYNNTIYIMPGQNVPLIASNEWDGGNADSTFFWNNIFHVAAGGRVTYVWDKSTRNFFDRNVFYGDHVGRPTQDAGAITGREPQFQQPGALGFDLASAEAYRLIQADSLFAAGRVIPENGGRDFFGNPLPSGTPYVGAHQFASAVPVYRVRDGVKPPPRVHRYVDARGVIVPPSRRPALPVR